MSKYTGNKKNPGGRTPLRPAPKIKLTHGLGDRHPKNKQSVNKTRKKK